MDPGGAAEAIEERPNSLNGSRADHEAPQPDARPNWERWVVDIKDEINKWFPNQTNPSRASTSAINSKIRPSIYREPVYIPDRYNHFNIGWYVIDERALDYSILKYVAFMTRWLGLDINQCVQFIAENQDLVRDYYDWGLGVDSSNLVKRLLSVSCVLCIAIVLFQKVRNGTKILEVITEDNNSDLTDRRSLEFSRLCLGIMSDPMRTKLEMLNLGTQIPWFVVEAVFANSNLSKLFGMRLDRLAMTCFDNLYPRANKSKVQRGTLPSDGFRHLLHIFHWTRTPEGKWLVDTKLEQEESIKRFTEFYIPNATNLLGSATTFKRLDGGSVDVMFSNNRVSGVMSDSSMRTRNSLPSDCLIGWCTSRLPVKQPVVKRH